ncbi:DegT/DnrJ/EryC1/StrS family aminotransferase [Sphingomonas sp. MMS24-JH45]
MSSAITVPRRAFEREVTDTLFAGRGATVAVGNATLGLMLALTDAVGARARGKMALVPAFTFAATAQAAWWAGLTPLVADVAPDDWAMCPLAEEALLRPTWPTASPRSCPMPPSAGRSTSTATTGSRGGTAWRW